MFKAMFAVLKKIPSFLQHFRGIFCPESFSKFNTNFSYTKSLTISLGRETYTKCLPKRLAQKHNIFFFQEIITTAYFKIGITRYRLSERWSWVSERDYFQPCYKFHDNVDHDHIQADRGLEK
jgi:hypothetical protein